MYDKSVCVGATDVVSVPSFMYFNKLLFIMQFALFSFDYVFVKHNKLVTKVAK